MLVKYSRSPSHSQDALEIIVRLPMSLINVVRIRLPDTKSFQLAVATLQHASKDHCCQLHHPFAQDPRARLDLDLLDTCLGRLVETRRELAETWGSQGGEEGNDIDDQ